MGGHIRFTVNLIPGALQMDSGEHPFIDIDDFVRSSEIAETAGVDAVFFADSQAISPRGLNFAYLDPLTVLPAISQATESIGLIATASTTYGSPYALARAILSIDHISRGRAGWNVITTMEPAVAQNFGFDQPLDREQRYARAEEFVRVVEALWDSWRDDPADLWDLDHLDRSPINYHGEHFDVAGPLQLPRSRQGRPIIFQAGGSNAGVDLAAGHADGVFSVGLTEESSRRYRDRLADRRQALRGGEGRVLVLPGVFLTVGSTEREVEDLLWQAENALDGSFVVARFADRYGLAPEGLDLDGPVPETVTASEARASIGFAQGGVDLARTAPDLTLRRFIVTGGGGHRRIFGTPESICDGFIDWVSRGAADGFTVFVESLPQFAAHIVPILRDRGVHRHAYSGATLREHFAQHDG